MVDYYTVASTSQLQSYDTFEEAQSLIKYEYTFVSFLIFVVSALKAYDVVKSGRVGCRVHRDLQDDGQSHALHVRHDRCADGAASVDRRHADLQAAVALLLDPRALCQVQGQEHGHDEHTRPGDQHGAGGHLHRRGRHRAATGATDALQVADRCVASRQVHVALQRVVQTRQVAGAAQLANALLSAATLGHSKREQRCSCGRGNYDVGGGDGRSCRRLLFASWREGRDGSGQRGRGAGDESQLRVQYLT